MTNIGVTGAEGFLGWHLRVYLSSQGLNAVVADRQTMGDRELLTKFVAQADGIIHLAGVNRGSDSEVSVGNTDPAVRLAEALKVATEPKSLAYANSQKAGEGSVYGQSKAAAAEILAAVQESTSGSFSDVRLPHLFGEHGRPFYNSGVTTFAHQLALGELPQIENDIELELLHAQDAAVLLTESLTEASGPHIPSGQKIKVSGALSLLQRVSEPYLMTGKVPEMTDRFELRMFNMFRSHLYPENCPISLSVHTDARGSFYESIRAEGKGQTSISTTMKGETRGDHFHFDKVERFVVISGEATIRTRQMLTPAIIEYEVSSKEPVAIDMPTLHAHNITNTGDTELVTLFWTNDLFDPLHPDTVSEPV